MRRSDRSFDRFSFGGRVPGAIGLLLSVTLASSLLVAFGSRHTSPLFELGALVPGHVFRGEVWRLVTWVFIEPSAMTLIFSCLVIYWFGRPLAEEWGSRHFLQVYAGVAAFTAVNTCVLALVDRDIVPYPFLGAWPMAEAITVAWGLWFPTREIRIYFIIPVKGVVLAWGTVAVTIIYAVYAGWEHYVPSLLAEGAMLAWLHREPVTERWARWRRARVLASRQRQHRAVAKRRDDARQVLHRLEAHDNDLPPLPPELENKLGRVIQMASRDPRKKRDNDKT
jgi:membrane associated rhomboid family serine protease